MEFVHFFNFFFNKAFILYSIEQNDLNYYKCIHEYCRKY